MKLVLTVAALGAAALVTAGAAPTIDAPPPGACEGLTICVPVGGPWVVVPARAQGAATSTASWQLTCPEGVVGGLDASVANTWIAVNFTGRIGSPVNPGITTTKSIVFQAVGVGPLGAASSFLPVAGCIPAQGGQRTPTGRDRAAPFHVGEPVARRVNVLGVRLGQRAQAVYGCERGERLLSAQVTTGLYTAIPPTPGQFSAVQVTHSVHAGRVTVIATRRGLPSLTAVDVQTHLLCAQVVH
jgi:hypothetical protein